MEIALGGDPAGLPRRLSSAPRKAKPFAEINSGVLHTPQYRKFEMYCLRRSGR